MLLDGKVALVTGGARRVGRAIVEQLAAAGARVVVHHAHSADAASAVCRALAGATAFEADLRTADGCVALLEHVRATHGHLDVLVNSAADYRRAPFSDESDDDWRAMLELNLVAPARLIRLALPLGVRSIVNLVDIAAWQPWRRHASYAAAKAGLLQLTRNLALELAPSVRVNAVAPGTAAFPPDYSDEEKARAAQRIPLGRAGTPADIGRAVRYLCEEDYATGTVLTVDGGAQLR